MVEVRLAGEGWTPGSTGGTTVSMNNLKTLLTWLLLCIVCAGGTILGIQILDKPLGLRDKVANFAH
jgi:hypothetical protein